jgi:hypothetical protein
MFLAIKTNLIRFNKITTKIKENRLVFKEDRAKKRIIIGIKI